MSLTVTQATRYSRTRAPGSSVSQYLGDFRKSDRDHGVIRLLAAKASHPYQD